MSRALHHLRNRSCWPSPIFRRRILPSGRELWYTALYGVIIIGTGTGLSGLRGTMGAQRTGIGLHHRIAFLDDRHRSADSRRRTIAWTHHRRRCWWAWLDTILLVAPEAMREGFGGPLLRGFLLLQLGCSGWALRFHPAAPASNQGASGGQRRGATTRHRARVCHIPRYSRSHTHPPGAGRSIGAVVYLVVFGSIVGYSAYIFALDRLPVSVVSIYNYINPIIAVFLGLALLSRALWTAGNLIAMLIIFAGVALVKRYSPPPSPKPARVSAAS